MQELISIVVPVYNVAPYLDRCVQSIIEQTYKNLEIILVDDGSTDESSEICENWKTIDSRIKVIHQVNEGLSGARNTGLKNAKGLWVAFWDSDDWTEPYALESATNVLHTQGADVVIWGYIADFVDNHEKILKSSIYSVPDCLLTEGLTMKNMESDSVRGIHGYAWNKLYRTKFIKENGISFPKGVYLVEDIIFNMQILKCGGKIVYSSVTPSHYIQRRRETLGTKYHSEYFDSLYNVAVTWTELFSIYGGDKKQQIAFLNTLGFQVVVWTVQAIVRNNMFEYNEKKEVLKNFLSNEKVESICSLYKPKNMRDIFLKFLFKYKLLNLIIMAKK